MQPAPRRTFKSLVVNLGLLSFSFLLCFACCELAFRVIYPPAPPDAIRSFEFSHSWRLNADGFRDADLSAKESRQGPAVLFLGDSFTAGMGVETPDAFAGLLERDLFSQGFRVFNLGKIGTGTTEHAEILQKYAGRLSAKFVFLFFYWNDVQDCLTRQQETRGAAPAETVKTTPFLPVPANVKSWLTKSVLYRWAAYKGRVLLSQFGIAKLDFNTELDFFDKLDRNPRVAEGWKLVGEAVAEMKETCVRHGAKLIVINVPKREQFTGWDKILRFYHVDPAEYGLFVPNKKLREICEREGVALIDITKEMMLLPEPGGLYYRFDTHFTPRGNLEYYRLIAPLIGENLKKSPSLSPPDILPARAETEN